MKSPICWRMLGVDVVVVQVGRLHEADAVRLVVDRGGSADGAADVGVLVLLADLAVGVGDDVLRVGVDAEETGDLGDDAGLLQTLADGALGRGLADVLGSAGERPLAGVAAALEEDGAGLVDDEEVAGRDEGVRLRGVGSL